MSRFLFAVSVAVALGAVAAPACAQTAPGQEVRRVFLKPRVETTYEERERTVYVEKTETTTQRQERVVRTPRVEYRWEPRTIYPLLPLTPPQTVWQWAPHTTWETRTEVVEVPVTRRYTVPEKRVERVPVTTLRMVEEQSVTRVAPSSSVPYTARRDPFASGASTSAGSIGGVQRYQSDPPRSGNADTPWRPAPRGLYR